MEGVEDLSFSPARVDGAFEIEGAKRADDRGHFARVWCARLFSGRGLAESFAQVNTGVSGKAGTLRGMHYQLAPHAEVKLARCVRGAVFDVAVDLRPASPTYRRWHGCELSATNGRMLYVPEGCAHGYLTLTDHAELMYFTTAAYAPQSARGVRHDDPAFGIAWPAAVNVISPQDAAWPDFRMEPT